MPATVALDLFAISLIDFSFLRAAAFLYGEWLPLSILSQCCLILCILSYRKPSDLSLLKDVWLAKCVLVQAQLGTLTNLIQPCLLAIPFLLFIRALFFFKYSLLSHLIFAALDHQ